MPVSSNAPAGAVDDVASGESGCRISSARGRLGSRRMNPFDCSERSWWDTLEELVSPTDSPISRMLGG
jgi:hypothetical protein